MTGDPFALLDQWGLEVYGADWYEIKDRALTWMMSHPERVAAYAAVLQQFMGGWQP